MTKPTSDMVARMLGADRAVPVPANATLAEVDAYYRELASRGTEETRQMFQQDFPRQEAPATDAVMAAVEAMALTRYKVVPAHSSLFWSHAVVAGNGSQQLYTGREVECQNMAAKFTGAFLDGAFLARELSGPPSPTAAREPRTNRDQSVAVSPTYTYNEDMTQAPRGVKLILLGQGGVAQLSEYQGDPFWIGWAALPRRAAP